MRGVVGADRNIHIQCVEVCCCSVLLQCVAVYCKHNNHIRTVCVYVSSVALSHVC